MSDETVNEELAILKEQAKDMGISFHPSIGLASLKEKINEVLKPKEKEEAVVEETKSPAKLRQERKKEATKLIRVNITCMDPKKKEWEGEVIKVISKVTGSVTKYVAFGTEEGYHIPNIIYKHMRDVMYQGFRTKKDRYGNDTPIAYQAKAYAIQVLPPLTEAEFKALKESQLARGM